MVKKKLYKNSGTHGLGPPKLYKNNGTHDSGAIFLEPESCIPLFLEEMIGKHAKAKMGAADRFLSM